MSLEFVPMLRRVMVNGQEKTAAPATVTRMVYDEESGKTLDALLQNMGAGGGFTLEKLWENQNPNIAFNTQTIEVDLSQYDFIEYVVKSRGQASGVNPVAFFQAPKSATSFILPASEVTAIVTRVVTSVDDSNITFGDGNFYNLIDGYSESGGNYAIPISIYGIKTSPAFGTGSAITWDDIYPVGSYYYSGDAEFDPNTAFGGTWEKVAENLALRQASTGHAVGSAFGEAEHLLTADEMPAHAHAVPYTEGSGSSAGVGYKLGTSQVQSWHKTIATGGGQPHNNIGPSLAVNIWHKTANGGKVVGQNGKELSYSTAATKTGEKWIDGKDMWRIVINVPNLPNNNIAFYPISAEVDTFVHVSGFAILSPSFIAIPNGHPTSQIENSYLICYNNDGESPNKNAIGVRTGKDMSAYAGQFIVDFTKTTE